MEHLALREGEEYIKLGQAMKKANLVMSGAEAARLIEEEKVSVNGEKEMRRGRKLYAGDSFTFDGIQVIITV